MEAKLLSECGSQFVIDDNPKDRYVVEIQEGDFLVIDAGSIIGTPAAKFTHPNVAKTSKKIYEFKRHRANGSKFWTSKAGVSHFFIVPKSAITILPEKGFSYVHAIINGVKVSFNVSGGTVNGWSDWLRTNVSISVGHSVKDLKAIAQVAVRGTDLEPIGEQNPPVEVDEWARHAAMNNKKGKEAIATLVTSQKAPIIHFARGYECWGETSGKAVEVLRSMKKVKIPATPPYLEEWKYERTGPIKGFIVKVMDGMNAKVQQVNWVKTFEANGIPFEVKL
jgi:hypothetical protein